MSKSTSRLAPGYEYITHEIQEGDIYCTITQKYSCGYDTGHKFTSIFDGDGNILYTDKTLGKAPKGRLTYSEVLATITTYLKGNIK